MFQFEKIEKNEVIIYLMYYADFPIEEHLHKLLPNEIERLEQFVNLLDMVQIDGEIDDSEYYLLETLAIVLGFNKIQDINIDKALDLISKGFDSETIAENIASK